MVDGENDRIEQDEEALPVEEPDAETPPDEPEGSADPEQQKIEALAREMGWRSEADWDDAKGEREGRRKPKHFVDAATFIARAEASAPIRNAQMRELAQGNAELRAQVGDIHAVMAQQQRMHLQALQRAREQGMRDAEAKMREAVAEGDTEKYDVHRKRLDEIANDFPPEEPRIIEERKPQPQANPVIEDWITENPWFRRDNQLNNSMIDMHKTLFGNAPATPESLNAAKQKVVKAFPEKFQNVRRQDPPAVNAPTGQRSAATAPRGKRWEDIPYEDRQAYERQAKIMKERGTTYTKEEFMKEYAFDT